MQGVITLLYAFLLVHGSACSSLSLLNGGSTNDNAATIWSRDNDGQPFIVKRQVAAAEEVASAASHQLHPLAKNALKIGGGFVAGAASMLGIRQIVKSRNNDQNLSTQAGYKRLVEEEDAFSPLVRRSPNAVSEAVEHAAKPAVNWIKHAKNAAKIGGGFAGGAATVVGIRHLTKSGGGGGMDPYAAAPMKRQVEQDSPTLVKRNPNAVAEAVEHAAKPAVNWVKHAKNAAKIGGGFAGGAATVVGIRHLTKPRGGMDASMAAPPMDPPMRRNTEQELLNFVKRSPNAASEVAEAAAKPAFELGKHGMNAVKVGGGFAAGAVSTALLTKRSAKDLIKREPTPGEEVLLVEKSVESAAEKPIFELSNKAKDALKIGGGFGVGAGLEYALDEAFRGKRQGDKSQEAQESSLIRRNAVSEAVEHAAKPAVNMMKHAKNFAKIGGGAAAGAGVAYGGVRLHSHLKAKAAERAAAAMGEMPMRKRGMPVPEEAIGAAIKPFNTFEKVGGGFLAGAATTALGAHVVDKVRAMREPRPSVYVYHAAQRVRREPQMQHDFADSWSKEAHYDSHRKRSLDFTADEAQAQTLVRRNGVHMGPEATHAVKKGGKAAAAMAGGAIGAIGGAVGGWFAHGAKNRMIDNAVQRGRDEALVTAGPAQGGAAPARRFVYDERMSDMPLRKRSPVHPSEFAPLVSSAKEFFKTPAGKKTAIGAAVGGTAVVAHHVGTNHGHAKGYGEGMRDALGVGGGGGMGFQKRSAGNEGVASVVRSASKSLSRSLSRSASSASHASVGTSHAGHGISVGGKTFSRKAVGMAAAGGLGTAALTGGIIHGRMGKSSQDSGASSMDMGGSGGAVYKRSLGQDVDDDQLERRQGKSAVGRAIGGKMNSALMAVGAGGLFGGGLVAGHMVGSMNGKVSAYERQRMSSYYKRDLDEDVSDVTLQRRQAGAIGGTMHGALLAAGSTGLFMGGALAGHSLGKMKGKMQTYERRPSTGVYKRDVIGSGEDELVKRIEVPTGALGKKMDSALLATGAAGLALGGIFAGDKIGYMRGKVEGLQRSRSSGMYYKRDVSPSSSEHDEQFATLARREPGVEQGIAKTLRGAGFATGVAGLAFVGHKLGKHLPSRKPSAPMMVPPSGGGEMDAGVYKREAEDVLVDAMDKRDLSRPSNTHLGNTLLKPSIALYRRDPEPQPVLKQMLFGGVVLYGARKAYRHREQKKQDKADLQAVRQARQRGQQQDTQKPAAYLSNGLPAPTAPRGVPQSMVEPQSKLSEKPMHASQDVTSTSAKQS